MSWQMVILTVVLSCRSCFLNQASYDGDIVSGWSVKEESLSETSDSQSWLYSVISLLRSRKISVLQAGLGDIFLMSGSLGLGRWHLWLQGKLKITRWNNNEYVIAVLVRRVTVKISNSTGNEILVFYCCFNGFGPYRRESRSKWNLCITGEGTQSDKG